MITIFDEALRRKETRKVRTARLNSTHMDACPELDVTSSQDGAFLGG